MHEMPAAIVSTTPIPAASPTAALASHASTNVAQVDGSVLEAFRLGSATQYGTLVGLSAPRSSARHSTQPSPRRSAGIASAMRGSQFGCLPNGMVLIEAPRAPPQRRRASGTPIGYTASALPSRRLSSRRSTRARRMINARPLAAAVLGGGPQGPLEG